jgi:hypothetical protein
MLLLGIAERGPASVYPAIRDGWPAGARKLNRLGGTLARETAIPARGGLLGGWRTASQNRLATLGGRGVAARKLAEVLG